MKARRILTTLAVGLGLVVTLLWLLGNETPDSAPAEGSNDQDTHYVAWGAGCSRVTPCLSNVQITVNSIPGKNSRSASVIVNQDLWNPIAENSIVITDSTRKGWDSVAPYTRDPSRDGDTLDWITITMAHDGDELYVRYKVDDGLPFDPDGFRYNVFVDVDRDRNTGFLGRGSWLSIGADVLVQGGYRDQTAVVIVWEFTGASQEDWSWSEIHDYPADDEALSDANRDIEWKIPISDLDVLESGVTSFDWVAFADNEFDNPGGLNDFYPDGGHDGAVGDFNTYTLLTPNPERGFYHQTYTYDPYLGETAADYKLLATHPGTPTLTSYREDEGITLIHRMFFLGDFVTRTISAEYLDNIQADFETVRAAGLKMIVRFAYTPVYTNPVTCAGESDLYDASKEWILTHTRQLSDVLWPNSDVIAAVQAGFIGGWGEWWGSCHFPDLECGCSPDDAAWDDRRDVLFAILDTLPTTRMVQLRTPRYKYNIFSDTVICSDCIPQVLTPLNKSQAHTGIPVARTGHHNDCFVSSASDYGTYIDSSTEYSYLISDTLYVVMGGETCDPSYAADPDPRRLECFTATTELDQFHWSFLSIDWYTPTLQIWRDEGCFPEIEQRLGYRFAFLELTFPDQVTVGQSLQFSLQIRNEGYAAPYNPRVTALVLSHTDGLTHTFKIYDPSDKIDPLKDPRFWLADETHTTSYTITIPLTLPAGSYELFLNLPDPELPHRPEYAIRLAGCEWEPSKGYNKLSHSVTVTSHNIYLPVILKKQIDAQSEAWPFQERSCLPDL